MPRYSHKAMMAQLHIAPKELGMDEETRRDFIAANFKGKRSSKDLTFSEQFALLKAYENAGWKPKKKRYQKNQPGIKKQFGGDSRGGYDEAISRLMIVKWRELATAGKVNDNSAKAMEAWIAHQTNKPGQDIPSHKSPDTLTGKQANELIERLKVWLER